MKITVRKKLVIGFLLMIILILGISIENLRILNNVTEACSRVNNQYLITDYCNKMEIAILECRRAEKNFWLRNESKYIDEIKVQISIINNNINMIKKSNPDKNIKNHIYKINVLINEYFKSFIEAVKLFNITDNTKKEFFSEERLYAVASRELQTLIPLIVNQSRNKMEQEISKVNKTKIDALKIIIIEMIIAFIIGIIIAMLISRNIVKAVLKLMETIDIIKKGNFKARVDIKSNDELGILGNYFNKMLNKIEFITQKQQLLQKQIITSEKLASLGRLSAGIAHEINNPLTGILTFSHLILKKMDKNDQVKEDIETIIKEATRCRNIIRELLDFARDSKTEKKLSNINKIIDDSLSLVKSQKKFTKMKVITNLSDSIPLIFVDPGQLEQVFLNIILNSFEAMQEGGELKISSYTKNEFVFIEFVDEGYGILQENINKVFEPFFTTKGEYKGTGLGLAVSYGIIEKHNGSINIESNPGEGTEVIIKLPLKTEVESNKMDKEYYFII